MRSGLPQKGSPRTRCCGWPVRPRRGAVHPLAEAVLDELERRGLSGDLLLRAAIFSHRLAGMCVDESGLSTKERNNSAAKDGTAAREVGALTRGPVSGRRLSVQRRWLALVRHARHTGREWLKPGCSVTGLNTAAEQRCGRMMTPLVRSSAEVLVGLPQRGCHCPERWLPVSMSSRNGSIGRSIRTTHRIQGRGGKTNAIASTVPRESFTTPSLVSLAAGSWSATTSAYWVRTQIWTSTCKTSGRIAAIKVLD